MIRPSLIRTAGLAATLLCLAAHASTEEDLLVVHVTPSTVTLPSKSSPEFEEASASVSFSIVSENRSHHDVYVEAINYVRVKDLVCDGKSRTWQRPVVDIDGPWLAKIRAQSTFTDRYQVSILLGHATDDVQSCSFRLAVTTSTFRDFQTDVVTVTHAQK